MRVSFIQLLGAAWMQQINDEDAPNMFKMHQFWGLFNEVSAKDYLLHKMFLMCKDCQVLCGQLTL